MRIILAKIISRSSVTRTMPKSQLSIYITFEMAAKFIGQKAIFGNDTVSTNIRKNLITGTDPDTDMSIMSELLTNDIEEAKIILNDFQIVESVSDFYLTANIRAINGYSLSERFEPTAHLKMRSIRIPGIDGNRSKYLAICWDIHPDGLELPDKENQKPTVVKPDLAQTERLQILTEECGEVIQAISKIKRFGFNQGFPGKDRTNKEDLEKELGDLICAVNRMIDAGDIDRNKIERYAELKKISAIPYLFYQ